MPVDLVFTTNLKSPVSGFSKWKVEIDKAAGVTNWRFHDLRRTATTGMAEIGVPPHIVDRILNHSTGTISGVAAIYNRFEYREERVRALDAWAKRVTDIVAGRNSGNASGSGFSTPRES